MTKEEFKMNIEEAIYHYEKNDDNNYYYTVIADLKWVLEMFEQLDDDHVCECDKGKHFDYLV